MYVVAYETSSNTIFFLDHELSIKNPKLCKIGEILNKQYLQPFVRCPLE